MEIQFKFELGDVLQHVGEIVNKEKINLEGSNMLVVVERGAQQCSGGTQYFYDCRGVYTGGLGRGPGFMDRLIRYHEVELIKR